MDKQKTNTGTDIGTETRFMSFSRIFISVVMLIFMGILTISSLISTTGMEVIHADQVQDTFIYQTRESWEWVRFYSDGIIGNVIWLVICAAACFFLMPLMKRLSKGQKYLLVATWTLFLGTIWVYSSMCAPTEDSGMVTWASQSFAKNDFGMLEDRYFSNYSYQLGYVFFNEIFIRIASVFGEPQNLLFLEVLNVFLITASYIGIMMINQRIFKDQRILDITVLLLLFAVQPLIFSTFLYGIIPGLAFAVYALLFMVIYFQSNKFHYSVLSSIFTALAVMVKSNNNILLVAIVTITFVLMFRRKKFIRDIIYAAVTISLSLSISPTIISMYESRSGINIGDAVPYISWFSMGLNEASNGPGWYNGGYTVGALERNDFDPEAASRESMEEIKNRVKYFIDEPQYRHDFFYKKYMSQWNETSYQSIWNNVVRSNYSDRGKIAEWVCFKGERKVKRYMDIYAQFVFAAALIGIAACLKNKNFLSITFPLVILGGMLYHLLAESKSQYSMSYFILMIGFSAYGLLILYDMMREKTRGNRYAELLFTALEPGKAVKAQEITPGNDTAESSGIVPDTDTTTDTSDIPTDTEAVTESENPSTEE